MIISTDIVTSNPCLFSFLFFFFFFFFSLRLLFVMPHTSHLQVRSPTSIALLFLQLEYVAEVWSLNALCVSANIACWPLDRRRILHQRNYNFACAATSGVAPGFDREWLHQLANGSQLHAFSQGRAFLCFVLVVYAQSIGDRRTETCGRKKKEKTPMALHLLPASN